MAVVVKSLPASSRVPRDMGSIPGLGRSPGERNGNPLQYSCLKIPCQAPLSMGVTKSRTQLSKWAYESKGQAWWNSRTAKGPMAGQWQNWALNLNLRIQIYFPYISLWTCLEVKGYYHIYGVTLFSNCLLLAQTCFIILDLKNPQSLEKTAQKNLQPEEFQIGRYRTKFWRVRGLTDYSERLWNLSPCY